MVGDTLGALVGVFVGAFVGDVVGACNKMGRGPTDECVWVRKLNNFAAEES